MCLKCWRVRDVVLCMLEAVETVFRLLEVLEVMSCRGVELRSFGGALRACRCGGMELGSSGGALQACRCRGMELWRRDIGVWIWR